MNHYPECSCEESLCETIRGFSAHHPDSVIYQTSLMSALLSGVYEGSTTIADLLTHGDFGLGPLTNSTANLSPLAAKSISCAPTAARVKPGRIKKRRSR